MKNVTLDVFTKKQRNDNTVAVKVVGLTHYGKNPKGKQLLVELKKDDTNPYDKDAIKVVNNNGMVGYVANNRKSTLKNKYYNKFKSASDLRPMLKANKKYYGILEVKGSYGLMKISV